MRESFSRDEITILSQLPAPTPKSYFERLLAKLGLWPKEAIYGGPSAVRSNLIGGLTGIGQPFRLNPPPSAMSSKVGVLGGISALRRAISAKKHGRVKWLVAGPNLVVMPDEYNDLLVDSAIDLVVTPSRWVSDVYERVAPRLSGKLVEWAVGIDEDYWKPSTTDPGAAVDFMIFAKIRERANRGIVKQVAKELERHGLGYKLYKYGYYDKSEYLQSLRECRALIYLTESESQGIALFEAWACDVPTLVWDRQYWDWKGRRFESSSAPYLTDQCGLRFRNLRELPEHLDAFIGSVKSFAPRSYILDNFTQVHAAKAYVTLFSGAHLLE